MSSCIFCGVEPERAGVVCDACCAERMMLEARFQGRWYRAVQVPETEGRLFLLDAKRGARIVPRFVLTEVRDPGPRSGPPSAEGSEPRV